jgi:hypothetical protein
MSVTASLTLRNATVIVDSKTVLRDHTVVVRDGVIISVEPSALENGPDVDGNPSVDCAGRVLVPGLINTHDHFYGRAAMGMPWQVCTILLSPSWLCCLMGCLLVLVLVLVFGLCVSLLMTVIAGLGRACIVVLADTGEALVEARSGTDC